MFIGLVPADTPLWVRALLVLVIVLNEALWYVTVARVFSLPKARAGYTRVKTWVDRCFGTLIAGFGAKIALS